MNEVFWLAWIEDGVIVRTETREQAELEASRLSEGAPGTPVYVLKALSYFTATTLAVQQQLQEVP